jgi:endonuclease/exonuclease/phosphatase family metal-dependent hydrolase
MLNDFLVQDVRTAINNNNNTAPDIIVVGLQEADVNSSFQRQFVSERLAKSNRLGPNYEHIASAYTIGITKGKKNYLQLGVLFNRNSNYTIRNRRNGSYRDPERLGLEGKGGVFVDFLCTQTNQLNNQFRLGFINAHLNSRSNNRRNREITEILREFTNASNQAQANTINNRLNNNFDVVFFMGDLNYRLQSNQQVNQQTTVNLMSNLISNQLGRNILGQLDTLPNSDLVNPYGFTFPQAHHLLPTYKKYYQDRTANNPCNLLVTQGNQVNNIEGCYFHGLQSTNTVPYNQQRMAFEIGWLDRIGYKIGNRRTQPNAGNLPMAQVLAQGGGAMPRLESRDNVILSDHTPVILKVDVM